MPLRHPLDKEPWVGDRTKLWTGIALLTVISLASVRHPHGTILFEQLFSWLGLPVYSNEDRQVGWNYPGILIGAAFLYSFYNLLSAIQRDRLLLFVVAILVFSWMPDAMLHVYQRTMAPGVYAVYPGERAAQCNYKLANERITGSCTVQLTNRGGSELLLKAALVADRRFSARDEVLLPNIPIDEPIALHPRQSSVVKLEFDAAAPGHPDRSGSGNSYVIILSDSRRETHI
jgi:hypothetical protein